jgi:hypothetical protein
MMKRRMFVLSGAVALSSAVASAQAPTEPTLIPAAKGPASADAKRANDPAPAFPAATGNAGAPVVDSVNKIKLRQREGAKLVDRRGRFERRGDRYVFLSEYATAHFVVVENLMLERVAGMIDDAAGGELIWSISGVITEFRGSNFLLLQRAVVKASGGPSEPRRLDDPLAGKPAGTTTSR